MKKKLLLAVAGLLVLLYSVYCISDFVRMAHQGPTRELARKLAAVTNGLEQSPIGLPRAEEFLRRLKAVDARSAPAEVQSALHDYISAMEGGLDAMRAGRDSHSYDAPMAESKERLGRALKKYE